LAYALGLTALFALASGRGLAIVALRLTSVEDSEG